MNADDSRTRNASACGVCQKDLPPLIKAESRRRKRALRIVQGWCRAVRRDLREFDDLVGAELGLGASGEQKEGK